MSSHTHPHFANPSDEPMRTPPVEKLEDEAHARTPVEKPIPFSRYVVLLYQLSWRWVQKSKTLMLMLDRKLDPRPRLQPM